MPGPLDAFDPPDVRGQFGTLPEPPVDPNDLWGNFTQAFGARRLIQRPDRMDANELMMNREYGDIVKELGLNADQNPMRFQDVGVKGEPVLNTSALKHDPPGSWLANRATRGEQEELIAAEIARQQKAFPGKLVGVPTTVQGLYDWAIARENARTAQAERRLGATSGVAANIGSFAGGVTETSIDTPNLATLPLGGWGKTALQKVLTEGLTMFLVEGAQQPIVAQRRAERGKTLTFSEAAANSLMAGVGGLAFRGSLEGGKAAWRTLFPEAARAADAKAFGKAMNRLVKSRKFNDRDLPALAAWLMSPDMAQLTDNAAFTRMRRALDAGTLEDHLLSAFFRTVIPEEHRTPEQQAALQALEREAGDQESSPYVPTEDGMAQHRAQLTDATRNALDPSAPPTSAAQDAVAEVRRSGIPPSPARGEPLNRGDLYRFIWSHLEDGGNLVRHSWADGGDTKYGIAARYHPHTNVPDLTEEEAIKIYDRDYWFPELDNAPPAIQAIAFDAAFLHSKDFAKQLVRESGGDVDKAIQMYRDRLNYVADHVKGKARWKKGWQNRITDLENWIKGNRLEARGPPLRGAALPLPNTRGEGVFYHGARGEMPELNEGYYNPSNIYGGFDTFYTTEALDVAGGYRRRNLEGRIYRADERAPVKLFDMEEPRPLDYLYRLFGHKEDDFGLVPMAIEEATKDGKANLREVMDEIRDLSAGEGVSRDDVQEIFDSAIYNLRQEGFGGMTHTGGLRTGRDPHQVRIYFDAPNQLDLTDVTGEATARAVEHNLTPGRASAEERLPIGEGAAMEGTDATGTAATPAGATPGGARAGETTPAGDGTQAGGLPGSGELRGGLGLLESPRGPDLGPDRPAAQGLADTELLAGSPERVDHPTLGTIEVKPSPVARDAARRYMEAAGLTYEPPDRYAPLDPERATRIADAFTQMAHDPHNPEVAAAYQAMIRETLAQFQAIKATGLKIEAIDGPNPYATPRDAILDVQQNNHLWFKPTDTGFGSDLAFDPSENPLLAFTDEMIGDRRLRANDVFRIVHDYFGHVKDGHGFRAEGEENAWQSHAAMYSPEARRAMTTETRGQNSWVNYGPHGEANRAAGEEATIYADQKVGLLPDWVEQEGRLAGEASGSPKGEAASLERDNPIFSGPMPHAAMMDAGLALTKKADPFTSEQEVPISALRSSQEKLDTGPKNEPLFDADVTVMKSGGELHVIDGNHRIAKALEQGSPTVKATVVDMDAYHGRSTEPAAADTDTPPEGLAEFDEPAAAAKAQTDSLEHDMRMAAEGGEGGEGTPVGGFYLDEDGKPQTVQSIIAEYDKDRAAVAELRACIVPGGAAAP